MNVHLFGASTPTGYAFTEQASKLKSIRINCYSRTNKDMYYADFLNPSSFCFAGEGDGKTGICISFGPIWLFSSFIKYLHDNHPERLAPVTAFIVCSSSSVLTKRFSANQFDKNLVDTLSGSEDLIADISARLNLSCYILRPSIIYGQAGPYVDKNISQLLKAMRVLPLLPLPAKTGLRQPIHVSQLASVALHYINHHNASLSKNKVSLRLEVGGDSSISYAQMLRRLQEKSAIGDKCKDCTLLFVPNRLFFFLASPFLLLSPKFYEALMRISVNLSGFFPSFQILGSDPVEFPLDPFA